MSDYVVGLTGGIGSGKSTVADLFGERGIVLVDTDAIAHELTGPAGAGMPALLAEFGAGIADRSGALDRAAMRRLVFADASARARLEAILHPMIRQLSAERCRQARSPYVILAVPLLVESGTYRERCDRILVVDCPESLQIERVMKRSGLPESEVQAIISTQATREQRRQIADDTVTNDGALTNLYKVVEALDIKYRTLCTQKAKAKC